MTSNEITQSEMYSKTTKLSRSQMTPSPESSSSHISVNDSESDSSEHTSHTPAVYLESADREDNSNTRGVTRSESVKSLSSLIEQNTAEDIAKTELKKLTLDQNGTFMADFDPEKSQREMRKMNRRLYRKEAKKNQLYDDKGVLLETHLDLCDCLEKDCPGCHLPCPRCGSLKCGTDCRCNRKFTIDLIMVEGTDAIYNFPT
uniref:ARF7 effector protein C-terminal domain-containing protein n=1 Tax=Arion vulgaris TaxID=1028688 RepID=A0A0B6ZD66_9EUPU